MFQSFLNQKIGFKILVGFAVALVFLIFVGGLAVVRLNEINSTMANLTGNLAKDQQLATSLVEQVYRIRIYALRYLDSQHAEDVAPVRTEIDAYQEIYDTADQEITNAERRKSLEAARLKVQEYEANFEEIVTIVEERDKTRVEVLEVTANLAQANLEAIQKSTKQSQNVAGLDYSSRANIALQEMRVNVYKYLQTEDDVFIQLESQSYQEALDALASLAPVLTDPSDRQLVSETKKAVDAYYAGFQSTEAGFIKQTELVAQLNVVGPEARAHATEILNSVTEEFNTLSAQTAAMVQQTIFVVAIAVVVALAVSITLGLTISNAITRPLQEVVNTSQEMANNHLAQLAQQMDKLAGGDLTCVLDIKTQLISVRSKDEVGQMGTAFNEIIRRLDEVGKSFSKMTANLQDTIGQVAENAFQLSAASSQLASAANQAGMATSQISTTVQQIARGTSQQSESINSTASSVEQMSRAIDGVSRGAEEQSAAVNKAATITGQLNSAIEQVTGNAQAVTKEASEAARSAREGASTVSQTIQGMESIRAKVGISAQKVEEMGSRSEQIGAIVEAIEDIASQTNLLALNAAIEAARAGEHGKGFAVVADEVRKLAERASSSTKEIGGLIKAIQKIVNEAVKAMQDGAKEVDLGVIQANQAGKALEDILRSAEAVNKQSAEAARATQNMAVFATELINSVDSVSAVVEENTAATEEMAASSSEVTQSIANIASVSEENSAAVEEVSASTEEMSAQVEEVSASAQSLAESAQQLQALVERFKLSDQERVTSIVQPTGGTQSGFNGSTKNARKQNGKAEKQEIHLPVMYR